MFHRYLAPENKLGQFAEVVALGGFTVLSFYMLFHNFKIVHPLHFRSLE